MEKLYKESIVEIGKYKGKKISELMKDKKKIFSLIKEGFNLDDSVLVESGIKKVIHSVSGSCVVVEHNNEELKVKLKKDTIDAKTLISEMEYEFSNSKIEIEEEQVNIENNDEETES